MTGSSAGGLITLNEHDDQRQKPEIWESKDTHARGALALREIAQVFIVRVVSP